MLKISLIDSTKQRQLIVEGKLIAPWAELKERVSTGERRPSRPRIRHRDDHIMKTRPEGENVILELNAECLIQSQEAVHRSGFAHQTVIPQNSGRAAILSRFFSRN
jgi:hypothetical protein